MQAVIETIFDAVYLVSVITIGILMIRGSKGSKQFRLFGLMAVVLGAGDSFHLIPRALALCTTGLENYTVPLGLGKWITSVTMTVFYVLLYYVWRQRYQIKGKSGLRRRFRLGFRRCGRARSYHAQFRNGGTADHVRAGVRCNNRRQGLRQEYRHRHLSASPPELL